MENVVNLPEMIHRGGIFKDVEGSTPQEVFANVCKMMSFPDGMTSEQVYNALCAREEVLSTAVGNGIALPHARAPIVKDENEQRICVVYLKNPIDMSAPDERSVYVMFILLTQNSQTHIKVLSELAALFSNVNFRRVLETRADEPELFNIINELNN